MFDTGTTPPCGVDVVVMPGIAVNVPTAGLAVTTGVRVRLTGVAVLWVAGVGVAVGPPGVLVIVGVAVGPPGVSVIVGVAVGPPGVSVIVGVAVVPPGVLVIVGVAVLVGVRVAEGVGVGATGGCGGSGSSHVLPSRP